MAKCSKGCSRKAKFQHPEWPDDEEQNVCRLCRISLLEELCDTLLEQLTDARDEIKQLSR